MTMTFNDYKRVSRLEYLPAEAPALFIPVFLVLESLELGPLMLYFEGVLVFSLLYFSGFIINASTDIEVDKKCKNYVAESAENVGIKGLREIVAIQVGLAIVLSFHLSYLISSIYPVIFVVHNNSL